MPFGPYTYDKLPSEELVRNWFNCHIEPFLQKYRFDTNTVAYVDDVIAQDVCRRYFEDMKRYKEYSDINDPSMFKKMGHLAFWIRKLKPITKVQPTHPEFGYQINEVFALNLALFYCSCAPENPRVGQYPIINEKLWQDLLFYFRYKSVSPHSLAMLLNAVNTVEFEKF